MKENIEIQATSFERIRPYRMNEASENGEVSAAIESMGKHGSINSYFYVKLSAQLLAQLPAFNTMKFLLSDGGSWNLIFYTGTANTRIFSQQKKWKSSPHIHPSLFNKSISRSRTDLLLKMAFILQPHLTLLP